MAAPIYSAYAQQKGDILWAPKYPPTKYTPPHKPITRIADLLAKHKGDKAWREEIVRDDHIWADYIQSPPGSKVSRRLHPDTREWWVVMDGQIRFEIEGQEPFITGKGAMVQVPLQTQASGAAVSTILKIMLDKDAPVSSRQRQFGTADAAWASSVAVDTSGVYVVGQKLADAFRDEWELAPAEISAALEPASAFVAKFEKTAAAIGSSAPRVFQNCVVNAASFVGGGVAAGEMVTIFGSGIGPDEPVGRVLTEDGKLATTLAGTRVLFNGIPAPLLSVSDNQSSAIVPYAVTGRSSVDIQVEYKGNGRMW
jgi:hypothetical protein